MRMKMFSVVFICVLIVDNRIGALAQKNVEPRECRLCSSTNCNQTVRCPDDQPYCITVASAPNFTSTLGCGAAQISPCVLEYKTVYLLTCICDDDLCNAPYNQQLLDDLLNVSTKNLSSSDDNLTEIFFKNWTFANVSNQTIYEMVTINNSSMSTTIAPITSTTVPKLYENSTHGSELPRAEALKHATVPPDDDEDESEGSGIDESKVHVHASPAAPSSFLPAEENNAPYISLNIVFFIAPFLHRYLPF